MKLYHVARRSNLPSIMQAGLLAVADEAMFDAEPGVNLITDPNKIFWGRKAGDVVLEIDTSELDPARLIQLGDWWWRYLDAIPAAKLKVQPQVRKGMPR